MKEVLKDITIHNMKFLKIYINFLYIPYEYFYSHRIYFVYITVICYHYIYIYNNIKYVPCDIYMKKNKFNEMQRILIQAYFNRIAVVRIYQKAYPDYIPAPFRQSFRRYPLF